MIDNMTLGEIEELERSDDPAKRELARQAWAEAVKPITDKFGPDGSVGGQLGLLRKQLADSQMAVFEKSGLRESLAAFTDKHNKQFADLAKVMSQSVLADVKSITPQPVPHRIPDAVIRSLPNQAAETTAHLAQLVELQRDMAEVLHRLVDQAEAAAARQDAASRRQTWRFRLTTLVAVIATCATTIGVVSGF